MKILLAITFVYGILRLLSYTPLFKMNLVGILNSFFPVKDDTFIGGLFTWLDMCFFYFCLIFQAWYWIIKFNI